MRIASRPAAALLSLIALLLTACQGVYTRAPLATVQDDRVTGEWRTAGEDDTFLIRREGNVYVADPLDEKPTRFTLFRVGATLYAQSGSKPCEELPGEAECYSLARLELGDKEARLFPFDTAAMFGASLQEDFVIPYELRRSVSTGGLGSASPRITNNFLLTGDEPAVRAFLAKYGPRFTPTASQLIYTRVK